MSINLSNLSKKIKIVDPLYIPDKFSKKEDILRPLTSISPVFSGCECLPVISKFCYKIQSDSFKKFISPAVFDYYAAVLTLSRIIHVSGDELNEDEEDLIMKKIMYVPDLLSIYLAGMGSTKVQDCVTLSFSTIPREYIVSKSEPLFTGWFGTVNQDTHILYGMYPCLAVYAKRIIEDIRFTREGGECEWNLPEGT